MAGSTSVVDILGVRLDVATLDGYRAWVSAALMDPWDGRCRQIVTLNPEYVMAARRDPEVARALRDSDLATADGVGVQIAARWLDRVDVPRLTGVTLTEWLAELSGSIDAPLFLLGAAPGVADKAAENLRARWPGARIAGVWAEGTPRPVDDAASVARIAASGARAVAVAYGAPGQILWIERNQAALADAGVRVAIGVGGALDYLSGAVKQPPMVVRRLGLEWLVRLAREPWRWRRQLVLPTFALLVARAAVARRLVERNR